MTNLAILAVCALALGGFALKGLIYGVVEHLEGDDR